MQQYQNVLQDKFGNVIVGASVAVYVYGTTTPATIYSGNGTGLLPSNTVTTSSLGEFAFYAANGRYSLSITATNFVAESYSDFILYDPADIGAVTAANVAFTPFGTVAATNVQNAIQEVVTDLSASSGSSLVGFLQSGTNAQPTTVQAKLRETVSVKDFGAVGDGIADDTAAIQAARDYISLQTNKPQLIFPEGVYKYTASPNWAISDSVVQAEGDVRLRYTGTEYAVIFDAGVSATIFNVRFLGNFIVEATAAAKGGFYVRSVHHSKIQGRVDGCGASYFGLSVLFSVCSEFSVNTTINEIGAWYSGAQPSGGIYISKRNVGELTTACTFINPIVEGVSAAGIVFDYASNNTILGGTSEGNGGAGISLTANAVGNLIEAIDFESNTGDDVYDLGFNNNFIKINSTGRVVFLGTYAKLLNSSVNSIADNATGTALVNSVYNSLGTGTLTGTAIERIVSNLLNASGYFEQNKSYDSVISASTSVPTAAATTVLTIDTTGINGNRFYHVFAYSAGVGAAYSAYAVVYRDGSTLNYISGTNGANLSITVSGLNVLVTQTSGITLTVFAKANAI